MEMSKTKQCYLLSYISTASISAAIITPALPNIQRHFLIDKSQLNQVVNLFLLGYVFGGQLTSYLSWTYCLWFLAAYSLVQLITTFLFTEKNVRPNLSIWLELLKTI